MILSSEREAITYDIRRSYRKIKKKDAINSIGICKFTVYWLMELFYTHDDDYKLIASKPFATL